MNEFGGRSIVSKAGDSTGSSQSCRSLIDSGHGADGKTDQRNLSHSSKQERDKVSKSLPQEKSIIFNAGLYEEKLQCNIGEASGLQMLSYLLLVLAFIGTFVPMVCDYVNIPYKYLIMLQLNVSN